MRAGKILPLLVLIVILSFPTLGLTRQVHDFDCANCHKPNSSLTSVGNIVCLDCHTGAMVGTTFPLLKTRPGNTNPVSNATFAVGDASDAMGSVTAQGFTPGDQTSHNWAAADKNPAAGATAPSSRRFYGRQNYSGRTVNCGRCHDPHGYDDNPKLLKLGTGTEAAMCNDCHVSWASDSAPSEGGGVPTNVHPMVTDYATIAAAKPAEYNSVAALNAAAGEVALNSSGGIDCLSCHGVHFTDSDSSTVDGVGQSLNPSDGKVLKANGPKFDQANVTGVSLCQSCHKYKDHGTGRTNPIGCLVCHGAHLEDTGGTMNNYMLRSSITTYLPKDSAAGTVSGLAANLTTTPNTSTRLWNYCFTCHNSADAVAGHNSSWNCSDCHSHAAAEGSWSAAGGCNKCHGYPPSENVKSDGAGGNAGYADGYELSGHFKNESNTQHVAHAGGGTDYSFKCSVCHKNNDHIGGSFADVFLAPIDPLVDDSGQLASSYVAATGTCSAVYCHSNGGPRGAVPTVNDPDVWEGGAAITTCDACHGNDSTDMATRNNSAAHLKHLNAGYGCQVCHADTAANATTLAAGAIGGTHVNGTADVAFDGTSIGLNLGATSYGTDGTCSVYCHSNGTARSAPDWDLPSSGECGSCHEADGVDSGTALSDPHRIHLYAAGGPRLYVDSSNYGCDNCHTHAGSGADHVNGVINLRPNACDGCHGSDGVSTSGDDQIPVWTNRSTVSCKTCHSGSVIATINSAAPAKLYFSTAGHGKPSVSQMCTPCHSTTADSLHLDGILDNTDRLNTFVGITYDAAASKPYCSLCHSGEDNHYANSYSAGSTDTSTDGDNCVICHDPHGQQDKNSTDLDAMLRATIGGRTVTGFSDKTDRSKYYNTVSVGEGVCQTCHDPNEVNNFNRTTADTSHGGSSVCINCHSHTTTPAFKASCDGCHGNSGTGQYWPYGSGGNIPTANDEVGEHDVHVLAIGQRLGYGDYNVTMYNDAQQKAICEYCHAATSNDNDHGLVTGLDADVFVAAGGGRHAKSLWGAADADAVYDSVADTCSNIDCHNSKPTLDNSYGWYDGADNPGCILCHNDMTDTGTATGQTHAAHTGASAVYGVTINCAGCHDAATDWSTKTKPASNHINGNLDIGGTVALTYSGSLPTGSSFGSCGTNACHEDGKGNASVEELGDGYTWGTAEASACGICHAAGMTTAAHSKHLANSSYVPACTSCHTPATAATHINGSVTFDASRVVYDGSTGSCSTNVCHTAGDWRDSSPKPGCTDCHSGTHIAGDNTATGGNNYLPHYNMHDVTPTISGMKHKTITSCGYCHAMINAQATHIDGVWEADSADNSAQNRGLYNNSPPLGWTDGSPSTCATVCHFGTAGDGGAWARKWSGTAANNDGTECGNCHGDFANGWVTGVSARHSSDPELAAYHGGPADPCKTCHTLGDSGGAYDWATQHRDGKIQLSNNLGWVDHGATVGCSNCHSADDDADDSMSNGEHEMEDTYKYDTPADGGHDRWDRVFQNGGGGSCTTCHAANGVGHDNAATENATVHTKHVDSVYINGCTDCHSNSGPGNADHNNGTVNFNNTAISSSYDYAKTADFGGTCGATNGCHDSDPGEWASGNLSTGGDNSCADCHASSAGFFTLVSGYPPTTNAHTPHIDNNDLLPNNCYDCHSPGPLHKNKQIDVGKQITDGSRLAVDGTCTNTCHLVVDGRDWTSGVTLACADCHDAPGKSLDQGGYPPTSGEHTVHLASNVGVPNDCTDCHGADATTGGHTTHKNGTVDNTVSYDSAVNETCTNNCHNVAVGRDWATANSLVCGDCHGSGKLLDGGGETDLSASIGPNAGRHDEHMASSLSVLSNGCTDCHGHSGTMGSYSTSGHINGSISFNAAELSTYTAPDCTNICHDVTPAVSGDWLDSNSLDCVNCHSSSYVGGIPTSGLHGASNARNHTGSGFSCTSCHQSTPTSGHKNGTTQDSTQTSYSFNATNINSYSQAVGCSAVSACHQDGGGWSRKWVGAVDLAVTTAMSPGDPVCGNCHGDFSSGFRNGVSGRHTGVDADGAIRANHQGVPAQNDCYLCHGWGHSAYTAAMHRDGNIQVNSTAKVGFQDNGAVVGCANCHSATDGTADGQHEFVDVDNSDGLGIDRWTRVQIAGPEGNCDTCHAGNIPTGVHADASENAGLHTAHNASGYVDTNGNYSAGVTATYDNCDTCHGHNGSGATHKNGIVNFSNKISAVSYDYAKGSSFGGSCGAVNGCHDSDPGEWASGDLSSGGDNACQDCHGSSSTFFSLLGGWPVASGEHSIHLADNTYVPNDCSDCHGAAAATGGHSGHLNKAINVAAQVSVYNPGNGTCTNSCHTVVDGRDWTAGATLNCDDCHGAATKSLYRNRTGGSHAAHVNIASTPSAYGNTGNNSSQTQYNFNCGECHPTTIANHLNGGTAEIKGSISYNGSKQCSNVYCHSYLDAGNVRQYQTTPAWGGSFTGNSCAGCHANSPVSNAHHAHEVGFHYDAVYSGLSGFMPVLDSDPVPAGLTYTDKDEIRGHGGRLSDAVTSTSTVITCNVCHWSTVTNYYNDQNSSCATCHDGTKAPLEGNMAIADKRKHVNGSVDVAFFPQTVRSKAQLRDDLTDVAEISNNWLRVNGYKQSDGSSYDQQTNTLDSLSSWNAGGKTCTTSCHLWEANRVDKSPVAWEGGSIMCIDCHTRLPK